MPNIITAKIDVLKLDKARFFKGKPDKTGHSPLYCDIVLLPRREVGQFGDTHLVKQSKNKDEQVELPIIGSATERGQTAAPKPAAPAPAPRDDLDDEDVPF